MSRPDENPDLDYWNNNIFIYYFNKIYKYEYAK